MRQYTFILAAVVGLAITASSRADDDTLQLGRFKPTSTGIGNGLSTAADRTTIDHATANDDTELVRYYRGGYYGGGYRGYYGGGYRGGYYAGYRSYYGGGYRGGFYGGGYYAGYPSYYGGGYYGGGYYGGGYYGGGYGGYYTTYYRCAGDTADTVLLCMNACQPQRQASAPQQAAPQPTAPQQPMSRPLLPGSSFKYDGGPNKSVPLPIPEPASPAPMPPPAVKDGTVMIGLASAKPSAKAFSYPAFGSK